MRKAILCFIITSSGLFAAGIQIESNDPQRPLVLVPVHQAVGVTAIEAGMEQLPARLQLVQNYPNPFNPETTTEYSIPGSVNVELIVFNLLGQKVRVLASGLHAAGSYEVTWDGLNDNGRPVGSGIYIYELKTDNRIIIRKMLLFK